MIAVTPAGPGAGLDIDEYTVGIYADTIDGGRLLLASVSAPTQRQAEAAARSINPQTLFSQEAS